MTEPCHSERRKIIRETDDPAESRDLLFAGTTTNRGALCLASFARRGIPEPIHLRSWKASRPGRARRQSRREPTAPNACSTVEERRLSAASSGLRETGLQPRWHRIQPRLRTRRRKRISPRLPHQPRPNRIHADILAMPLIILRIANPTVRKTLLPDLNLLHLAQPVRIPTLNELHRFLQ